jgi:hypothetical protein
MPALQYRFDLDLALRSATKRQKIGRTLQSKLANEECINLQRVSEFSVFSPCHYKVNIVFVSLCLTICNKTTKIEDNFLYKNRSANRLRSSLQEEYKPIVLLQIAGKSKLIQLLSISTLLCDL